MQAAIERNTRLATALLATHFETTSQILLKGLRLDEPAAATPIDTKATMLRRSAVAAG